MTHDFSESPGWSENVRMFKGCSTHRIASDGAFRYGRVGVIGPSVSGGLRYICELW